MAHKKIDLVIAAACLAELNTQNGVKVKAAKALGLSLNTFKKYASITVRKPTLVILSGRAEVATADEVRARIDAEDTSFEGMLVTD